MKRCIILVILVGVLFVSIGIAEDSEKFVFRNGIIWGMSPEEIKMHETVKLIPSTQFETLMALDVDVSKYKANLGYEFKDSQLFMINYTFQDDRERTFEVMDYLYGALSLKYGKGTVDTFEVLDDLNRFLYGEYVTIPKYRLNSRIYKFTNVDETDIYLYCDDESSGACIVYFNEGLFQELYGLYNTDGL